jgi:hypothetical protein
LEKQWDNDERNLYQPVAMWSWGLKSGADTLPRYLINLKFFNHSAIMTVIFYALEQLYQADGGVAHCCCGQDREYF